MWILAIIFYSIALLLMTTPSAASSSVNKPHIVFILADDFVIYFLFLVSYLINNDFYGNLGI